MGSRMPSRCENAIQRTYAATNPGRVTSNPVTKIRFGEKLQLRIASPRVAVTGGGRPHRTQQNLRDSLAADGGDRELEPLVLEAIPGRRNLPTQRVEEPRQRIVFVSRQRHVQALVELVEVDFGVDAERAVAERV